MAPLNDAQIAVEQGMMIAEVNMTIGAIDRILKMAKDGKSNNRELTNARVEPDRWRTRLLKQKPKPTRAAFAAAVELFSCAGCGAGYGRKR